MAQSLSFNKTRATSNKNGTDNVIKLILFVQ